MWNVSLCGGRVLIQHALPAGVNLSRIRPQSRKHDIKRNLLMIHQFIVLMLMDGEWSAIEFLVDARYVRNCETRKGFGNRHSQKSCTFTISLKAGQTLPTKPGAPGTLIASRSLDRLCSWFSGHLLFPKYIHQIFLFVKLPPKFVALFYS